MHQRLTQKDKKKGNNKTYRILLLLGPKIQQKTYLGDKRRFLGYKRRPWRHTGQCSDGHHLLPPSAVFLWARLKSDTVHAHGRNGSRERKLLVFSKVQQGAGSDFPAEEAGTWPREPASF